MRKEGGAQRVRAQKGGEQKGGAEGGGGVGQGGPERGTEGFCFRRLFLFSFFLLFFGSKFVKKKKP